MCMFYHSAGFLKKSMIFVCLEKTFQQVLRLTNQILPASSATEVVQCCIKVLLPGPNKQAGIHMISRYHLGFIAAYLSY